MRRLLYTLGLGLALTAAAAAQDRPSLQEAAAQPAPKRPAANPAPRALRKAQQGEWSILIRPANYDPANEWDYVSGNKQAFELGGVPAGAKMSYEEAYRSVTYRYQEYLANPSYRHDAALELMFGQMRPTTIVRNAYGPQPSSNVNLWMGYNWFRPPYSLYAGPLY